MKKNFYVWHRYLGIVTCVVVAVWSISGFFHPLMSWTQPRPVKMMLPPAALKAEQFGLTPEQALSKNNVGSFHDFNVVTFNDATYYQVRIVENTPLRYFSTKDGIALADGDQQYAVWLARQYLQEFKAPVTNVQLITSFDHEYKIINKLLPVYRVQFERSDNMRAFVDTSSGLLGTLNNKTKGALMWVFVNLHNWDWLSFSDTARIGVLVFFSAITMLMALSGLLVYGFFWKTFKPITDKTRNTRNLLKKYHRGIGVTVSLTMLLWAISAAYHALEKPAILAEAKTEYAPQQFTAQDAALALPQLLSAGAGQKPVTNISLVRLNHDAAYQVFRADKTIAYFDAKTGAPLENANDRYIRALGNAFSKMNDSQIVSVKSITKFDEEYGFINKRLPVMRVEYNDANHTRYFVEPAAGVLALELADRKRLESYSFNWLHKWHFLNWAGKTTRDVVMMIFVLLQTAVAASGLWMFVIWKGATGKRVSDKETKIISSLQPAVVAAGQANSLKMTREEGNNL